MYPKASHNQVIHHIQLSHWDQVVGTNNKYQAAFRNQSQCLALNHIRNELVQNAIHHSQHSNCECNDLRAFAPNPTRSQPSTTGCNLSLPDSQFSLKKCLPTDYDRPYLFATDRNHLQVDLKLEFGELPSITVSVILYPCRFWRGCYI